MLPPLQQVEHFLGMFSFGAFTRGFDDLQIYLVLDAMSFLGCGAISNVLPVPLKLWSIRQKHHLEEPTRWRLLHISIAWEQSGTLADPPLLQRAHW